MVAEVSLPIRRKGAGSRNAGASIRMSIDAKRQTRSSSTGAAASRPPATPGWPRAGAGTPARRIESYRLSSGQQSR